MAKAPADIELESPDSEIRSDRERELSATPSGRKELAGKLAGKSLLMQVVTLAIWPFFEQLLNFTVGFVDIAIAGRLKEAVAATSAIAVAGYIGWLMNLMHMAMGVGGTAIIARATGARHRRLANTALGQSLLLGFTWGLCIGTTIFILSPYIATWMGLHGPAHDMCVTYLRITSATVPLGAILFVGNACLRGAGDTFTPFVCMVIVNVVNTIVSILLVKGPGVIGGHGVKGIAIGTAVAWILGSIITLTRVMRGSHGLKLRLFRLWPNWTMMRRVMRIGLPFLLESSGQWGGNFVVLKFVSLTAVAGSTAVLGAHMIAIRLEAISYLPGAAIGTAAATLTGQYLGLGDHDRARRAIMICWRLGAGIMAATGLMFILFPEAIVSLATNDPELLETAPPLLRICGPVQFFFGTYMVLAQALRGAGATRSTAIAGNISTYLVRLPLAYLFAIPLGLGLQGIWFGLCLELVFRGSLFAGLFLKGNWARSKV